MTPTLREISTLDPARLASVQFVLADIDDTISTEGKITAPAFEGLWLLREAGLKTIVVTGRPAGWCDHIARFWPVDAVVGENGGFYFHHDGQRLHAKFLYSEAERAGFRARLEGIRDRILAEVPGCAVASDQPYRAYDLAIDFREDVAPLPREAIVKIKDIFEAEGAHAKISSIHVNGWFGEFDKLSTSRLCLTDLFGVDAASEQDRFIFCGDSPNDEPMFGFFPLAFGMRNLLDLADLLEDKPAFITTHRAGAGFREVVDLVLKARAGD